MKATPSLPATAPALDSATLTLLLKRMEAQGLVTARNNATSVVQPTLLSSESPA